MLKTDKEKNFLIILSAQNFPFYGTPLNVYQKILRLEIINDF